MEQSDNTVFSSSKLTSALEKLQWPMPVDYPTASVHDRKSFESAFRDLILLQEMSVKLNCALWAVLKLHSGENIEGSTNQTEMGFQGLYPLETLAHAISLRFRYHFETERETNRLDKVWFSSSSATCIDYS